MRNRTARNKQVVETVESWEEEEYGTTFGPSTKKGVERMTAEEYIEFYGE